MKKMILFLDCGDTLCDESTEVRQMPGGIVQSASLFPGAAETVRALKTSGHRICLVADGLEASFAVILQDIRDQFDGWVVSETIGEEKPSERMFAAAMEALCLTEADKPGVLMVGNNLKKDVVGANRFGIHSVLAAYSPRYNMTPENDEETPEYRLDDIKKLPELVRQLEIQLSSNR